jgi:hypothetical protein
MLYRRRSLGRHKRSSAPYVEMLNGREQKVHQTGRLYMEYDTDIVIYIYELFVDNSATSGNTTLTYDLSSYISKVDSYKSCIWPPF